ncbi:MAG TPA: right-handed parallel beta-helix repeat-containing protein [Minicystis sp.]|nr:right-handed parallel beta-helix repeat-containing protein [Minicystis sp.]
MRTAVRYLVLPVSLAVVGCGGGSATNASSSGGESGGASASSGHATATGTGGSTSTVGTGGAGGSGGAPPSADFFVAPDGDDAWSGALAAPNASHTDGPFATIGKAQQAVRGVDKATRTTPIVVMLRGGTYALASPLAFTSMDSGTTAAPVVYEAYPNETPVVSGGKRVTGFTETAPGTFRATLPASDAFEQLWVDGARRYRPRANGGHYLRIVSADASSPLDTFDMASATDLDPSWHDLGAVELVVFEQWTVSRMRLVSVDPAHQKAKTTPFTSTKSYHGFIANHRYLVENVKEALANPGEWYLDRATHELTYLAKSGEDPNGATSVVVPVSSQLLTADGLAETTFRGITFSHTSWVVPDAGYPAGQGLWNVPAAILVHDPVHVTFDACTIAHVGANGIEFEGNAGWAPTASDPYSAAFVNGAVYDTGAGGIRVGGNSASSDATTAQGVHVANDVVSGGGRFLLSGQAILVGESHHDVVEHNEVFDYYQTAISVGQCFANGANGSTATYPTGHAHDDVVQGNLVHDIGRGVTSDMGGVYLLTCDTQNNVVTGNVIHDVVHDPGGSGFAPGYGANGLYFDQGTSHVATTENLVYRVTGNGFQQNFGRDTQITNNVFAFAKSSSIDHDFYEGPTTKWVTFAKNVVAYDKGRLFGGGMECPSGDCTGFADLHDNLYWNAASGGSVVFNPQKPQGSQLTLAAWQSTEGEDAGSIVADPKFVAPAPPADDFTLKPGSPAFGIGFVAFDPTKAGRTSAVIQPKAVPAAAPLQEPADASTFF